MDTAPISTTPKRTRADWRLRDTAAPAAVSAAVAAAPPVVTSNDDVLIYDNTPRQSAMNLNDGVYRLVLGAIDEEPNPFDSAKRRLVWKFQIEGQEGTLYFYSSLKRGPRLEEALSALQVPFTKNGQTALKKSELLGRTCMGRVENVTTERGGVFPRLKQLFPTP